MYWAAVLIRVSRQSNKAAVVGAKASVALCTVPEVVLCCIGSGYYLFNVSEGRSPEEELLGQSATPTAFHAAAKQAAHENAERFPDLCSRSEFYGLRDFILA